MAKSQYYLYNFFSNNNEISIYYLNDGTVTGQREGSMFIFATVNGDIGHEEYRRLVGKITVLDEASVVYSFYVGSNACVGNSDGSQIYCLDIECSLDERWLKNIEFEMEDVTPDGYARIFGDLGVAYAAPRIVSADTIVLDIPGCGWGKALD